MHCYMLLTEPGSYCRSIYATLPLANMPTAPKGHGAWSYLASKAAASQLTRVLSNKLKADHVNVNAIAPGFFPSSESKGEYLI
jgi:NAD(P)-dependent dehydrogenase (short-subunit alcohol dehydrogenase family)